MQQSRSRSSVAEMVAAGPVPHPNLLRPESYSSAATEMSIDPGPVESVEQIKPNLFFCSHSSEIV